MRTQICSERDHCSSGPSAVVDQSSARMRSRISPPPAKTDSIDCVLVRSMARSIDSAAAFQTRHGRSPLMRYIIHWVCHFEESGTDETSQNRRSTDPKDRLMVTNYAPSRQVKSL